MGNRLTIIGLSGTNGAGKDLVGELLAKRHGYLFISVTELLRDEARRRGLPVSREHLRTISAEWRREKGLAVLVDQAMETFKASTGSHAGVVIASLRNPYEADRIHALGGVLVWVDADPRTRYERIQTNAATRGRSAEDDKTFEQFLEEEKIEMHSSGDEATLNMSAVKDRHDMTLMNDSDSLEVLDATIVKTLGLDG